MTKINRFIQFNDEMVEAETLLLYERLARALADANYLELTERKLLEFHPREGIVSMSVFWRHRSEQVMHEGRLSDLYLLTAGFWKYFDVKIWIRFNKQYAMHPLRKLATELLLLLEEFRLIDVIVRKRPGTQAAFQMRKSAYIDFHRNRVFVNWQKNFLADSLLSEAFIVLHEGMYSESDLDWDPVNFNLIKSILERAYDARSTEDSTFIVERIIEVVEHAFEKDLFHQYYSVISTAVREQQETFNYHEGMGEAEKGDEGVKETIEEMFRSWHVETKDEEGIHLQYELEHGRAGKADGDASTPGNEDANIEEIGYGQSVGDTDERDSDDERAKVGERKQQKKAGEQFGKEHLHVVYEEKKIEVIDEVENRRKLTAWREAQRPYVRSFVEEMKKRIDLKENARRERLMMGRLSSKLTTLVVDERPKPFYRKTAPSVELDAVFGLLVDGSASMIDKLDETKQAVLLFHDVLRELQVSHDISLYYEDAFKASKEVQPNIFEQMHTFLDRHSDNGLSILSFDAHEDNRDGFAIRWMAERLQARPEKQKFLLVFSDGEPSAFGYDRNGIIDTAEAVMETEKKGISVIHLFLSAEEATEEQKQLFSMMFGNKTAASNSVEGFTDQTLRILRKLFAIVI